MQRGAIAAVNVMPCIPQQEVRDPSLRIHPLAIQRVASHARAGNAVCHARRVSVVKHH